MLVVRMRPGYWLEGRVVLAGLVSRVVALTHSFAFQTVSTGRPGFVTLSQTNISNVDWSAARKVRKMSVVRCECSSVKDLHAMKEDSFKVWAAVV